MVYDDTVGERIGGIRVGLGAAIGNFFGWRHDTLLVDMLVIQYTHSMLTCIILPAKCQYLGTRFKMHTMPTFKYRYWHVH